MDKVIGTCNVRLKNGSELALVVAAGQSIMLIGANGAGKTRLGVRLDRKLRDAAHRIAAQKSLYLNDEVQVIPQERAQRTLWYGYEHGSASDKESRRWDGRPAIHSLRDFDALLQTLFAESIDASVAFVQQVKSDTGAVPPVTKLERIKEVWNKLLPHRALKIRGMSIEVQPGGEGADSYSGSQLSDGERAIFYFLGQSLLAPQNSALIVDEPEGHIHKAIVGPLWDAIERARPDCGFIYVTHDLDFAVTRPASAKYVVRSYYPERREPAQPESWEIETIPEGTGLPERVVAELVGNRKPVLFVEGDRGGVDDTLYRHVYSGFTTIPVGGCEAVIHSVASYKRSPALHRMAAKGIVDADDREPAEASALEAGGVYVLPVAEVENLLLLPNVFMALAAGLHCPDPSEKLRLLTKDVLAMAKGEVEAASARYTTRQLDRRLKKVTVEATDLATLNASYTKEIASINPATLYADYKGRLEACVAANDLAGVLRLYDNKGVLAFAARALDVQPKALMEKVGRLLGKEEGRALSAALVKELPVIAP